MATYDELLSLNSSSSGTSLQRQVQVAVVVAADVIRLEVGTTPNHTNRMAWAKLALQNPKQEAERMLWAVLAQNRALTVAQITGATDAAVQTAVNAAVDLLAGV